MKWNHDFSRRKLIERALGATAVGSIFKFVDRPANGQPIQAGGVNRNSAPSALKITDMRAIRIAATHCDWRGNARLDQGEIDAQLGPFPRGGDLVFNRKNDVARWAVPELPPGRCRLVIRARGASEGGERLEVRLDARKIGEVVLKSGRAAAYAVDFDLPSGARALEIEMVNDGPTLDAFVQSLELSPLK